MLAMTLGTCPMASYRVEITCLVPNYTTIAVEADSAKGAVAAVKEDIEAKNWESDAWQKSSDWEGDWAAAEGLSVTEEVEEGG